VLQFKRVEHSTECALMVGDVPGVGCRALRAPVAQPIQRDDASIAAVVKALEFQGTIGRDVIERRLANARNELQYAPQYRYRVVNDDLDRAVGEIVNIISSWEAVSHAG